MTTWNTLRAHHPVGPGSTVLVLGTGGVSLFAVFAVLLARAAGARVVTITSRQGKQHELEILGQ